MVPISVDPTALELAVAGRGQPAAARFRALRSAGAASVLLFCDRPDPGFAREFGELLRPSLPDRPALAGLRLLWIAGLPDGLAAGLARNARLARVLVNVEDRRELCDFHNVAEVRRGDLLLTVSTGGRSPALAARIRARLAAEFGPEWAARVDVVGGRRGEWRRQNRSMPELTRLTDAAIDAAGWLR